MSKRVETPLRPSQITFFSVYRRFRVRNKLFGPVDVMVVTVVASLVLWRQGIPPANAEFVQDWSRTVLGLASALAGVTIAGLAIFASIVEIEFQAFLYDRGELEVTIFPFWAAGVFWVASMLMSGIAYLATGGCAGIMEWVVGSCVLLGSVSVVFAISLSLKLFSVTIKAMALRVLYFKTYPRK